MPPESKCKEDLFLLGQLIKEFPDSETFPTNRQVLLLLCHYIRNERIDSNKASNIVVEKVFEIWNNKNDPSIQLVSTANCKRRVLQLYTKWRAIIKNQNSKSEGRKLKESNFTLLMEQAFDAAKDPNKPSRRVTKSPIQRPPTPPPLPEKRVRKSIAFEQVCV